MRKKRIRAKIRGQAARPRLCIFKSLRGMSIQIVNDGKGITLASANLKEAKGKNNTEGAGKLGKLIAKKCQDKKITAVVFDRSGYKYHGKIKAIAEGARAGGLKF